MSNELSFRFRKTFMYIKYVRSWMLQNKLKLNDSKTEFMIIGTP